jgi:predicted dehydrogenase
MKPFVWGILGTGLMARKFAHGLRASAGHRVAALVSRTRARGEEVGRALGVSRIYDDPREAVIDREIDAFYVATPPARHHADALLCLEAGKPVLVEKPFTLDGAQADAIARKAAERGVFCMEGMWTRFLPAARRAKTLLDEGAIGEPKLMSASFGFAETVSPEHWLYQPGQGGGALLDRGIYPMSLAYFFLGAPAAISGDATIGATGVDEQFAAVYRAERGGLALLSASLRTQGTNTCVIQGTQGELLLDAPVYRPTRVTLTTFSTRRPAKTELPRRPWLEAVKESELAQGVLQRAIPLVEPLRARTQVFAEPYAGNGYHYEADEVRRCVESGARQSAVMPLDESVRIMHTMDALRARWSERTAS